MPLISDAQEASHMRGHMTSRKSDATQFIGDQSSIGLSIRQSPNEFYINSLRRTRININNSNKDDMLTGSDENIEPFSNEKILEKTNSSFVPVLALMRDKVANLDRRSSKIDSNKNKNIKDLKQTFPMDDFLGKNMKH